MSQRERSRVDCIRIAASCQAMGWAILCAASRGSAHCNSLPLERLNVRSPAGRALRPEGAPKQLKECAFAGLNHPGWFGV
jgi:hypothetical protein